MAGTKPRQERQHPRLCDDQRTDLSFQHGKHQCGADTGRRSAVGAVTETQPHRHIADESLKRNRRKKIVEIKLKGCIYELSAY